MRVSILCAGSRVFGLEVMALTLARGLVAHGHEVFVLASGWNDGEFLRRLRAEGVQHDILHFGKISKSLRPQALRWTLDALWHVPGARRRLASHLRAFAPDVVISYNRDWMILAAPMLSGQRTIFHAHELPTLSTASRVVYRVISDSSRLIVAVSEHVGTRLRELGVPEDRTAVIYNGLDGADDLEEVQRPVRTTPTIGIIGQIAPWKGHDDLLDALSILRQAGHTFQCVVIGTGDPTYTQMLKDKAAHLNLLESISWRGYISDANTAFGEMDICVAPSRVEESFGLVPVEAALRRIPVVAARSGALSEIVVDGVTGYLTEPADSGALASRLATLLADADLRDRLGEAARSYASQRFRASRMVDGFEAALAQVTGS